MLVEIFCVLVLCAPLWLEAYLDRNGDDHKDVSDVIFRACFVFICSVCVAVVNPKVSFGVDLSRSIALSVGMFTFFFPYLMNIILYRRGIIADHRWWSYLGKKAIPDRWSWWNSTPWFYRMMLMLIVLLAGCIVYFCPCKGYGACYC
jgi:hypothetical protein